MPASLWSPVFTASAPSRRVSSSTSGRPAGRSASDSVPYALRGVYGELMLYFDPQTAGPALWAHRLETGETFEVSVAVLAVYRADRMGREALEISSA
jgi:hypothetical protein